jgi:hypothetical protein
MYEYAKDLEKIKPFQLFVYCILFLIININCAVFVKQECHSTDLLQFIRIFTQIKIQRLIFI